MERRVQAPLLYVADPGVDEFLAVATRAAVAVDLGHPGLILLPRGFGAAMADLHKQLQITTESSTLEAWLTLPEVETLATMTTPAWSRGVGRPVAPSAEADVSVATCLWNLMVERYLPRPPAAACGGAVPGASALSSSSDPPAAGSTGSGGGPDRDRCESTPMVLVRSAGDRGTAVDGDGGNGPEYINAARSTGSVFVLLPGLAEFTALMTGPVWWSATDHQGHRHARVPAGFFSGVEVLYESLRPRFGPRSGPVAARLPDVVTLTTLVAGAFHRRGDSLVDASAEDEFMASELHLLLAPGGPR